MTVNYSLEVMERRVSGEARLFLEVNMFLSACNGTTPLAREIRGDDFDQNDRSIAVMALDRVCESET